MPFETYVERNFQDSSLATIAQANTIIKEYQAAGYSLTLRQLYYQFVARDLLENTHREYKRLGNVMNDARLAGLVDWDAIEDRTRSLRALRSYANPQDALQNAVDTYLTDHWHAQPVRLEVWVEKEALAGVFSNVCFRSDMRIPLFSCRGYTSQSEMWGAAKRLKRYVRRGQRPIILHFGDHDPSGMDMTRDIADRLQVFGVPALVDRLALNMDQVDEHEPPPNYAKVTDSRYGTYVVEYGTDSWELDALDPPVLVGLVEAAFAEHVDHDLWAEDDAAEEEQRQYMQTVVHRWPDVRAWLDAQDAEGE